MLLDVQIYSIVRLLNKCRIRHAKRSIMSWVVKPKGRMGVSITFLEKINLKSRCHTKRRCTSTLLLVWQYLGILRTFLRDAACVIMRIWTGAGLYCWYIKWSRSGIFSGHPWRILSHSLPRVFIVHRKCPIRPGTNLNVQMWFWNFFMINLIHIFAIFMVT